MSKTSRTPYKKEQLLQLAVSLRWAVREAYSAFPDLLAEFNSGRRKTHIAGNG